MNEVISEDRSKTVSDASSLFHEMNTNSQFNKETQRLESSSKSEDYKSRSYRLGIASTDPSNPTVISSTQDSLIHNLVFNSTVSAYYYSVDFLATSVSSYAYMGFFLNVSGGVDADLTLYVETPQGEVIGKSWNRQLGEDELFVLAPNQYPNLYNKPLFINITAVNGFGEVEFYYRNMDDLNLVEKPQGALTGRSIALRAFNMIPLNYSSGENISATVSIYGKVGPNNRNVFEIYAFALNGNLSKSFRNWTMIITDDDMVPFGAWVDIEIGIVPVTEFDGLVLVVLGKEYPAADEATLSFETVVSLPRVFNDNLVIIPRNEVISTNLSIDEYSYFAFEVGVEKAVFAITINSSQGSFEHVMSRDPLFDPNYSYSSLSTMDKSAYYLVWKLNKFQLKPSQPGLAWYFFRLKGSIDNQLVQIFIQEKSSYWIIGSTSQTSLNLGTVTEGNVYVEILYLSSSPSETVVWSDPPSGVDIELAWFSDTGGTAEGRIVNQNGLGAIETLGEFSTSTQEMYVLLVAVRTGTGSLSYNVKRGADLSPPIINSVSFNSLNISNLEKLEFSIDAVDDLAVYNSSIEYREKGTQAPWKRFEQDTPTTAIPVYGTWELRVVVFDVAGNQAIDNNSSNYYFLVVRDEKPPEIGDFSLSIEPKKNSSFAVEVWDQDSGVEKVIIEYEYLGQGLLKNVTASLNSDGLYQIELPSADYGEEIRIRVFAKDKSGNWNTKTDSIKVADKIILFEVVAPSKTEPPANVSIVVEISANIAVNTIWLAYVFEGEGAKYLNATLAEGQKFQFFINIDQEGTLVFWLFAKDSENEITRSSNYTIVFEKVAGNNNSSSDPSDQNGEQNNGNSENNSTEPFIPNSSPLDAATVVAILVAIGGIGGGIAYISRTNLKEFLKRGKRDS